MNVSPLTPEQTELADRLLPTLTGEQRAWLAGYLTGLQAALTGPAASVGAVATAPAAAPAGPEVAVVYGSQTGNAQGLAEQLAERLRQAGRGVTLASLGEYELRHLKKAERLLLITSTQGDGDPPDNALAFAEALASRRAPRLEQLRYSILGLGDSSYEHFCKTGKDFDDRLAALGATALHPRVDCDLDYEQPAGEWMGGVLAALAAEAGAGAPSSNGVIAPGAVRPSAVVSSASDAYSRSHPFAAEILDNLELNGRGSDRSTRHVEISLAGSGLAWEPGDSVGVYPRNARALVDELMEAADWDPEAVLEDGTPLAEALTGRVEITVLTKPLLGKVANTTGSEALADLVGPGREAELRAYLEGRDLVDLIRDFGLRGVPAGDLVGTLRKLPPRLYSIASAASRDPEATDLTVRLVEYEAHGRPRRGVCSDYLTERQPGETLPVFVQRNPNFRLPADPDAPVIMIGPGTGVAPFRAFLQERAETGAGGRNWLFFGDRRFRTDFLYQTDWLRWREQGLLTRMDVAFSRDQAEKVYVQHRLLERAEDVYTWLEEGAHIYVCGDEKRMAPDVHRALATVVSRGRGCEQEAAEAYLAALRRERRYQRDVY